MVHDMRIISGKFKGKKLIAPAGSQTRPTSDRVKENMFNLLQSVINEMNIAECVVLDLYAGSGALGLEALSRGFQRVFFVENNKEAVLCIQKNLSTFLLQEGVFHICQTSVDDFFCLKRPILKEKFHLIFADPPYDSSWYLKGLEQIESSNLCHTPCHVVLEMNKSTTIPERENWTLTKSRTYGKTKIEIWTYRGFS